MTNLLSLLEQLRQPFPPDAISWLPGSTTNDKTKCMAMAYADLRAYQERLDEVCGLDWSIRYLPWSDGRIICELTICGVTRSSTGEMGAQDEKNGMGGTVAEAQAAKRAAAMFGLGRYLYELPAAWVAYDAASKKISKEGQTELDNRYKTWYTKKVAATAKHRAPTDVDFGQGKPLAQNAPATSQQGKATIEGDNTLSAHYAPLIDKLTGDCLERANRARKIHAQSRGPASPEQYRFLAGTIDDLVRQMGGHKAVLEVFVGRAVSSANPPGTQLAGKLLDALLETRTVEQDGEKVKEPNPDYNPDAVACVHAIWHLILEQNGQSSLFDQAEPEKATA